MNGLIIFLKSCGKGAIQFLAKVMFPFFNSASLIH